MADFFILCGNGLSKTPFMVVGSLCGGYSSAHWSIFHNPDSKRAKIVPSPISGAGVSTIRICEVNDGGSAECFFGAEGTQYRQSSNGFSGAFDSLYSFYSHFETARFGNSPCSLSDCSSDVLSWRYSQGGGSDHVCNRSGLFHACG